MYDMKKNADLLSEAIGKLRRVDDGTVVTYRKGFAGTRKKYLYVAVYVADTDRWYITGNGRREMTYDEMMNEFAASGNARIASGWTRL